MMTSQPLHLPKICPVCNSVSRPLFRKNDYLVRVCQVCYHQFAEFIPSLDHVQQVFDEDYFQGGRDGYFNYVAQGKFLRLKGQRYSRLVERHLKPSRVLDVGAAAGFVLQGFIDRGWSGYGLEPNPQMVLCARDLRIPIEHSTLEKFHSHDPFDLVLMVQVAAHLTNLQAAFTTIADLTRHQGFLLIETGDRESWTTKLRGKYWQDYSPPTILHWFSPKDLQRLVAQYGFREVARGRPQKWMNAAHLNFDLRQQAQRSLLSGVGAGVTSILPNSLPIPWKAQDQVWVLYQKMW